MRRILRTMGLVLPLMTASTIAGAGDHDIGAQLMAADRLFADAAAENGLAGWLDFMADDAVRLPDLGKAGVQGKAAIASLDAGLLDDDTLRLAWEPVAGGGFADGRHGYTTGRYRVLKLADGEEAEVGTGSYLTWWRLDDGAWKVILDTGRTGLMPGTRHALLSMLLLGLGLVVACGGDPSGPVVPSTIELKIRFVNDGEENIHSVNVRCRIEEPGVDPRELARNWQMVEPSESLTLVEGDTLASGTIVQTWYSVLALWSPGEPYERWRVWTAGADTVRTYADARFGFHWPDDRWYFTEVPWPPGTKKPPKDRPRPAQP